MVEAHRTLAGETSVEQRFYLMSLKADAQEFARAVRKHWGIENGLHWSLDVTFREHLGRLRKSELDMTDSDISSRDAFRPDHSPPVILSIAKDLSGKEILRPLASERQV